MEVTAGRRAFGCQSMTARLRRVLVRAPRPEDAALWRAYGWRGAPDPARLAEEHEAFRAILAEAGAEVVLAETPHGADPDVIAFDLPHHHGEREVMHLMSLLSPLDDDLVVCYPPLMPVRLVELLRERDIGLVEVP